MRPPGTAASRAQNLADRLRRNTAIVRRAKAQPCADCGIQYPFYVMQLDHVRGKKRFGLGRIKGSAIAASRILDEIAKCDVVCANCHAARTYTRQQYLWRTRRDRAAGQQLSLFDVEATA